MIRSEESRRTGIEVEDNAVGVANVMISRNLHTIQLKKIAFVIVSMMSLSIIVRHPCETPV